MWSLPLPDALHRTFTDALQKRVVKFLLKRTVGQFLASEIELDQVDVQLGDGRIHLHNLALDVEVRGASQLSAGLRNCETYENHTHTFLSANLNFAAETESQSASSRSAIPRHPWIDR